MQATRLLHHKIDLESVAVTEEVEILGPASVASPLHRLGHDEVLEQTSDKGVSEYLCTGAYSKKMRGKPNVREIYLGRLDETLSEICIVWLRNTDFRFA